MESLLNAHVGAMRELLRSASADTAVLAEALKLVEAHAKTARLLQEATERDRPYKDAEPPPAPKSVPRSINAMRDANERIGWCQARDAAEACFKKAVRRSEKLLKKSGTSKAAADS